MASAGHPGRPLYGTPQYRPVMIYGKDKDVTSQYPYSFATVLLLCFAAYLYRFFGTEVAWASVYMCVVLYSLINYVEVPQAKYFMVTHTFSCVAVFGMWFLHLVTHQGFQAAEVSPQLDAFQSTVRILQSAALLSIGSETLESSWARPGLIVLNAISMRVLPTEVREENLHPDEIVLRTALFSIAWFVEMYVGGSRSIGIDHIYLVLLLYPTLVAHVYAFWLVPLMVLAYRGTQVWRDSELQLVSKDVKLNVLMGLWYSRFMQKDGRTVRPEVEGEVVVEVIDHGPPLPTPSPAPPPAAPPPAAPPPPPAAERTRRAEKSRRKSRSRSVTFAAGAGAEAAEAEEEGAGAGEGEGAAGEGEGEEDEFGLEFGETLLNRAGQGGSRGAARSDGRVPRSAAIANENV